MFRAGEAQNGVVYSYQKVSMRAFETSPQRSLVEVFDDVIAHELPKLAR